MSVRRPPSVELRIMLTMSSLSPSGRRTLAVIVLQMAGVAGVAAPPVKFPPSRPPGNDVRMENLVAIPMRDGVVLYADVYRPVKEGRYPVLVSRTPYSTERYPSAYDAAVFFARRGRHAAAVAPRRPVVGQAPPDR